MTYEQLLATLPKTVMADDVDDAIACDGVCITCDVEGYCQDRARTLTDEVVAELSEAYDHEATEYDVLYWLLDNGEVGTDRNEDAEELARMYMEEKFPSEPWEDFSDEEWEEVRSSAE